MAADKNKIEDDHLEHGCYFFSMFDHIQQLWNENKVSIELAHPKEFKSTGEAPHLNFISYNVVMHLGR